MKREQCFSMHKINMCSHCLLRRHLWSSIGLVFEPLPSLWMMLQLDMFGMFVFRNVHSLLNSQFLNKNICNKKSCEVFNLVVIRILLKKIKNHPWEIFLQHCSPYFVIPVACTYTLLNKVMYYSPCYKTRFVFLIKDN